MKPRLGSALAILAALVAGAGLAVLLAAGPGTRLGWWTFRTGLGLLPYAAYAGLGGVVLAFAAIVVGLLYGGRVLLAVLAVLMGLAALAPPYLMRHTARTVPPIHDISTDTDDPPRFVAVVPLRKGALNSTDYGGPEIAAQQHRAYPDIHSVLLPDPPARAFERALAAARGQGWDIVDQAPAEGRIEATDTTRWFGFKDDVVVRVRGAESGSRVDVRSLSRVGKSDLGKNASRIRAYLQALGS